MCVALGITAAPRREKREQQKKDIAASYDMTVHKNNSITLVPITKKMRADREWEARKATGRVVEIDEVEVDLGSNYCFQDTRIDTLVWSAARHVDAQGIVKSTFICDIFARTRFFKELLNKEAALPSKYSKESYAIVQDKVVARLTALVTARLQKWEKQGLIQLSVYYKTRSGDEYYDWAVQPYIDEALRQMGLKSEFQANMSSKREEFYELRSALFEADYHDRLTSKRMCIEILLDDDQYDPYLDEEEDEDRCPNGELTNRRIAKILVQFFDVFRAKVCRDLELEMEATQPAIGRKPGMNGRTREDYLGAIEIINTYCAYQTTPDADSVEDPTCFYSMEELMDYYDEIDEGIEEARLEKERFEALFSSPPKLSLYHLSDAIYGN